jgi:hypothetical protein
LHKKAPGFRFQVPGSRFRVSGFRIKSAASFLF